MPYFDESEGFFYRRWTADRPRSVVLFLHGWGEQSGYYHRLAAELTRNGSEVWAPDHVGHGLSGQHDGVFASIDQLADNAEALLDRLRSETTGLPVILVGHSLGGMTALALASRRSDLDGLVVSGAPVAGRPADMDEEAVWSDDETYVDNVMHDPIVVDGPDGEESLWSNVEKFLPHLNSISGGLSVPTLVIYGEHDVLTTLDQAREWVSVLPNARLHEVAGGHHDILNDSHHRAVAEEICSFIEKIRAT